MKHISLSLVKTKAIKFLLSVRNSWVNDVIKSHLLIYTHSIKGQILSLSRFRMKICWIFRIHQIEHTIRNPCSEGQKTN